MILVKRGEGFSIDRIDLDTEVDVPGISESHYHALVALTKAGSPVSKALSATTINIRAALLKG